MVSRATALKRTVRMRVTICLYILRVQSNEFIRHAERGTLGYMISGWWALVRAMWMPKGNTRRSTPLINGAVQ